MLKTLPHAFSRADIFAKCEMDPDDAFLLVSWICKWIWTDAEPRSKNRHAEAEPVALEIDESTNGGTEIEIDTDAVSESDSESFLDALPYEIQEKILRLLDSSSLRNLGETSRGWRRLLIASVTVLEGDLTLPNVAPFFVQANVFRGEGPRISSQSLVRLDLLTVLSLVDCPNVDDRALLNKPHLR